MDKEKLKKIQERGVPTEVLGTLLDMKEGRVVADINLKWSELILAVIEAATQKGSMQINLVITPTKWAFGGGVEEVKLEHEVKLKKPERRIGESTFYVTDEGRLQRDHPDQTSIFDESKPAAVDAKSQAGGQ